MALRPYDPELQQARGLASLYMLASMILLAL